MQTIRIDPTPGFALSPYLYMQFMEPLGATDSSVEAAWDFGRHTWREDLIDVTRALAPPLIRWPGGCLSSYYRWREGVGPREARQPMRNLLWGGVETNQVGTHEFIDFCRKVGADPLVSVNMESDGRPHWAHPIGGGMRSAGPDEAAAWVDYCNNPENRERRANGAQEPFDVRLWQIGNETSYDPQGYDCATTAQRTLAFARAMRQIDPGIALIGWGDDGWAPHMLEVAGQELQYIAFHHHFGSGLEGSPLTTAEYRRDPELTWLHLMHAYRSTEDKIARMRDLVAGYDVGLALTESHFSLRGRNRCEVLSSWAAGVAYARVLNVHARNGDLLKIATLADFCGTRWMVCAVILPMPRGQAFLMPVARVMALYRHHMGERAVSVLEAPDGLDVTASRSGDTLYLHVVNVDLHKSVQADLEAQGLKIHSGQVYEIADDPWREIDQTTPELFAPRSCPLGREARWCFPAASVTALELTVADT